MKFEVRSITPTMVDNKPVYTIRIDQQPGWFERLFGLRSTNFVIAGRRLSGGGWEWVDAEGRDPPYMIRMIAHDAVQSYERSVRIAPLVELVARSGKQDSQLSLAPSADGALSPVE